MNEVTVLPRDVPTLGGTVKRGTIVEITNRHRDGHGEELVAVRTSGGYEIYGLSLSQLESPASWKKERR